MADQAQRTIVHIIRAPVGGAFRHVSDLSRAQAAEGHRVGVICDSLTGSGFDDTRIEALDRQLPLGVARFPMRRAVGPADMAAAFRLFSHIKALRPDVLHGHGAKGGAYARMIGAGLRVFGQRSIRLYCPHGGSLHFDAGSLKGRIYFGLERLMAHLGDGLIFVSDFERATYAAKVGTPRIPFTVVRNGLWPEEFTPVTPDPDARDVLFIGTLRDLKGVDTLIDALGILRDRGRPASAWIVGEGEEEAAYRQRAAERGLGDLIGFRPPMPIRQALPLARVMAVPSRAESLPYVVLEAAAAATPLIATAVGGVGEIFGPLANRLIPADDPRVLAETIADRLDNPAATGAEAQTLRQRVAAEFSVAGMEAAIGAFYARLLPVAAVLKDRSPPPVPEPLAPPDIGRRKTG